ncbi:MAG: hypothetical protein ABSE44_05775 [Candidatus Sulfotelmatobacter sp.]
MLDTLARRVAGSPPQTSDGTLGDGMKSSWQRSMVITGIMTAAIVGSSSMLSSRAALAAGKQTLTGEVGDAMCGSKHMPGEGTAAECTRSCVAHGSKYALVVGDKIYTLNASDKAVLALLDQQAGKKATVTGTVTGTDIDVTQAVAAK